MTCQHRLIFFVLILIMGIGIGLLIDEGSEAEMITVDDDPGEDFQVIQHAIENATDGDIIQVHDGLYRENILNI